MSHLTDEQTEQALTAGGGQVDPHLAQCPACRERADEAAAIRGRLRQAFAPVGANADLRQRVIARVRSTTDGHRPPARGATRLHKILGGLAAAAALAIVASLITLHLAGPGQANAASVELAQIHQMNLMPHGELHDASEPAEAAAYFKQHLGFVPSLPRLGAGLNLRGCCVAYFRNRPVGSYVVDSDRGVISIIVLPDRADSLRLGGQVRRHGANFHTGAFARNRIVAVERNGYTYCAVGETDTQWLIELLNQLLSDQPVGLQPQS